MTEHDRAHIHATWLDLQDPPADECDCQTSEVIMTSFGYYEVWRSDDEPIEVSR